MGAPYSSDSQRRASLHELADEALRRAKHGESGPFTLASTAALGVAALFRIALALEHLAGRTEDYPPRGRS